MFCWGEWRATTASESVEESAEGLYRTESFESM